MSDVIAKARKMGADRGKADAVFAIAEGLYGEPREPLSGEWADEPTPKSVMNELGLDEGYHQEVLDAYEDAYYDAWDKEDPDQ